MKTLYTKLPSSIVELLNNLISPLTNLILKGRDVISVLTDTSENYSANYFNSLFALLKHLEGSVNTAYMDNVARPPVMTIGIGFNLDQTGAEEIIRDAMKLNYSEIRNGQKSLTDEQVKQLFRYSLIGYGQFNGKAHTLYQRLNTGDLLEHSFKAHELIALQSMAFNNGRLVGTKLMQGISDNTAQGHLKALIEIIEYSNLYLDIGLANRRLQEAAILHGKPIDVHLTWRTYQRLETVNPGQIYLVGGKPIFGLPIGDEYREYIGDINTRTLPGNDEREQDCAFYGSNAPDFHHATESSRVVYSGDGDDHIKADACTNAENNCYHFLAQHNGQDKYELSINSGKTLIYDSDHAGTLIINDKIFEGIALLTANDNYQLVIDEISYRLRFIIENNDVDSSIKNLLTITTDNSQEITVADFRNGQFGIYLARDFQFNLGPCLPLPFASINYISNNNILFCYLDCSELTRDGESLDSKNQIFATTIDLARNKISTIKISNNEVINEINIGATTVLANGKAVFIYQYYEDDFASSYGYAGRIYNIAENTLGREIKFTDLINRQSQYKPTISKLDNGGFVIGYIEETSQRLLFYCIPYNDVGTEIHSKILLNSNELQLALTSYTNTNANRLFFPLSYTNFLALFTVNDAEVFGSDFIKGKIISINGEIISEFSLLIDSPSSIVVKRITDEKLLVAVAGLENDLSTNFITLFNQNTYTFTPVYKIGGQSFFNDVTVEVIDQNHFYAILVETHSTNTYINYKRYGQFFAIQNNLIKPLTSMMLLGPNFGASVLSDLYSSIAPNGDIAVINSVLNLEKYKIVGTLLEKNPLLNDNPANSLIDRNIYAQFNSPTSDSWLKEEASTSGANTLQNNLNPFAHLIHYYMTGCQNLISLLKIDHKKSSSNDSLQLSTPLTSLTFNEKIIVTHYCIGMLRNSFFNKAKDKRHRLKNSEKNTLLQLRKDLHQINQNLETQKQSKAYKHSIFAEKFTYRDQQAIALKEKINFYLKHNKISQDELDEIVETHKNIRNSITYIHYRNKELKRIHIKTNRSIRHMLKQGLQPGAIVFHQNTISGELRGKVIEEKNRNLSQTSFSKTGALFK